MATSAELVRAVRAHAEVHHEDGGWDVITECWSDEDIAKRIGKARTVRGALLKFRWVVDTYADQQAWARTSAF